MLTPLNLQGSGQNSATAGTARREGGDGGDFNALLKDVKAGRNASGKDADQASLSGERLKQEALNEKTLKEKTLNKEALSREALKERLASDEKLLSEASLPEASLRTSDKASADALRGGEALRVQEAALRESQKTAQGERPLKSDLKGERSLESADVLTRETGDKERSDKNASRQAGRDEGSIDFAASRSQRQALVDTLGQLQGNRLEKAARADETSGAESARSLKDAAARPVSEEREAPDATDLYSLVAPAGLQQPGTGQAGKAASGAVRQALAEADEGGRGNRESFSGEGRRDIDLLTRQGSEREGRGSARGIGERASEAETGALFGATMQRLDTAAAGASPRDGAGTTAFESVQSGLAAISGQTGNGAAVAQSQAVTTATLPAMESDQWSSALERQTLNLSLRGGGEAKLALNPAELGPMTISLRMAEQGAQLHIASHHAQVRAAVEAALPQLREAFGANGIELGQASVSDQSAFQHSGGFQGQGDGSARQGAGNLSGTAGMAAGPEEERVSIAVPSARALDGSIDLFA